MSATPKVPLWRVYKFWSRNSGQSMLVQSTKEAMGEALAPWPDARVLAVYLPVTSFPATSGYTVFTLPHDAFLLHAALIRSFGEPACAGGRRGA